MPTTAHRNDAGHIASTQRLPEETVDRAGRGGAKRGGDRLRGGGDEEGRRQRPGGAWRRTEGQPHQEWPKPDAREGAVPAMGGAEPLE